ncbi:hypothetical protein AB0I34_37020 [Kribbella sp. NPDC050281]|uniref:hypothetical protein n=1 Tax=Kribbella sp. NPDC050281 TaxID=3155515 RepID=UPI0033F4A0D8
MTTRTATTRLPAATPCTGVPLTTAGPLLTSPRRGLTAGLRSTTPAVTTGRLAATRRPGLGLATTGPLLTSPRRGLTAGLGSTTPAVSTGGFAATRRPDLALATTGPPLTSPRRGLTAGLRSTAPAVTTGRLAATRRPGVRLATGLLSPFPRHSAARRAAVVRLLPAFPGRVAGRLSAPRPTSRLLSVGGCVIRCGFRKEIAAGGRLVSGEWAGWGEVWLMVAIRWLLRCWWWVVGRRLLAVLGLFTTPRPGSRRITVARLLLYVASRWASAGARVVRARRVAGIRRRVPRSRYAQRHNVRVLPIVGCRFRTTARGPVGCLSRTSARSLGGRWLCTSPGLVARLACAGRVVVTGRPPAWTGVRLVAVGAGRTNPRVAVLQLGVVAGRVLGC